MKLIPIIAVALTGLGLSALMVIVGLWSAPAIADWNDPNPTFQDRVQFWREDPQGYAVREAPRSGKIGVFIVAGQSNAAAYGDGEHYVPRHLDRVFSYSPFASQMYEGKEPGPNVDGVGTSWLYRMADILVDQGVYDAVILVPLAMGAAAAADYLPGGVLQNFLPVTCSQLKGIDLPVTAILWQQGEREGTLGESADSYKRTLQGVIQHAQSNDCEAPWMLAKSTYQIESPSPIIRSVIDDLVALNVALPGPDTDTLAGPDYRRDGTHFTEAGVNAAAKLWSRSIVDMLAGRN